MKRQTVRTRILSVAEEQLGVKGYSHTTMDYLAEILGISKRTLYEYFSSKDKLVYTIIQEKSKEIDRARVAVMGTDKNVVEKMYMVGQTVQKCLGTILNANLLNDLKRNAPQLWEKIKDVRSKKIRALWEGIVGEGKRKGYIRKNLNVDILIMAYIASVEKLFDSDFILNSKYSIMEMRLTILEIFLNGVLTEKGRKTISDHQLHLTQI